MIFQREKGKSINTLRSTEFNDSSLKFGFTKHFPIEAPVASVDMKVLCLVYGFLFTEVNRIQRIILQPTKPLAQRFRPLQASNRWEFCVTSADGDRGPNRPVFNTNLITVTTTDILGVHCPGVPSGLDPSEFCKGDRPPPPTCMIDLRISSLRLQSYHPTGVYIVDTEAGNSECPPCRAPILNKKIP